MRREPIKAPDFGFEPDRKHTKFSKRPSAKTSRELNHLTEMPANAHFCYEHAQCD